MSPPACFLCQVLLFTDKAQSTVLYKALSLAYVGRLRFAEVRPAADEVVKQYKVDAYPTLIIVKVRETMA
jgi:protein disulfide-isomerase A6